MSDSKEPTTEERIQTLEREISNAYYMLNNEYILNDASMPVNMTEYRATTDREFIHYILNTLWYYGSSIAVSLHNDVDRDNIGKPYTARQHKTHEDLLLVLNRIRHYSCCRYISGLKDDLNELKEKKKNN